MGRRKRFITIVMLSGTLGLGAESLVAQTAPGGTAAGPAAGQNAPGVPGSTSPRTEPGTIPMEPATPGQSVPNSPGPTFPQPETGIPPQRPLDPLSQPAPGAHQSKPFPGQSAPHAEPVPGQTAPLPSQPGTTSPERLDQPSIPNHLDTPSGPSERQAPGTGAKLEGERRLIIPPAPPSTTPQPGNSGASSVR
jgi:hypothetical protein